MVATHTLAGVSSLARWHHQHGTTCSLKSTRSPPPASRKSLSPVILGPRGGRGGPPPGPPPPPPPRLLRPEYSCAAEGLRMVRKKYMIKFTMPVTNASRARRPIAGGAPCTTWPAVGRRAQSVGGRERATGRALLCVPGAQEPGFCPWPVFIARCRRLGRGLTKPCLTHRCDRRKPL